MKTEGNHSEIKVDWRGALLSATLILALLGSGCASKKPGATAPLDASPVSDMTPVWQNAGASPPAPASKPKT